MKKITELFTEETEIYSLTEDGDESVKTLREMFEFLHKNFGFCIITYDHENGDVDYIAAFPDKGNEHLTGDLQKINANEISYAAISNNRSAPLAMFAAVNFWRKKSIEG